VRPGASWCVRCIPVRLVRPVRLRPMGRSRSKVDGPIERKEP
jgi:hypothetical protein